MKVCVCSAAFGQERYKLGWQRLNRTLNENSFFQFGNNFVTYNGESTIFPIPDHKDIPYGFKPAMITWARQEGFDIAIWIDASVYAVRPLDPLIEYIDKTGWMLLANYWSAGEWLTDDSCKILNINREDSFKVPNIRAICMGFNFHNPKCNLFLDLWQEQAILGSFKGPWDNKTQEASKDSRVLGHRHDQSVAAVLAYRLGMNLVEINKFLVYQDEVESDAIKYNNEILLVAKGF